MKISPKIINIYFPAKEFVFLLNFKALNFGKTNLNQVKTALIPLNLELGMNIYWPSDREQENRLVQYLNDRDLVPIKVIDPILSHPIENLSLSIWPESALKALEIRYLGALLGRTAMNLLRETRLSTEDISEINKALDSIGLELGMNTGYWPSDPEKEERLVKKLKTILNQNLLTEREVQIVKMRLGIGENRRTLKETGQVVNVSAERVR